MPAMVRGFRARDFARSFVYNRGFPSWLTAFERGLTLGKREACLGYLSSKCETTKWQF